MLHCGLLWKSGRFWFYAARFLLMPIKMKWWRKATASDCCFSRKAARAQQGCRQSRARLLKSAPAAAADDRGANFLGRLERRGSRLRRYLVGEEAAGLVAPELVVMAAEAQQLGMRAFLDDASRFEYDQPVHARDGRQAVRDRDPGLAFHQIEPLLPDRELDLAVERRGRLVEHQDRRVLENHARERDALALPAGELDAALADVRLVAGVAAPVAQAKDEVVRLRLVRRVDHLRLGGRRPPVADVGGDRAVQQRGVLRHHADRGAQALLRHVRDVLLVDHDAAALDVVEAQQQVHQRGLAGARAADQADAFAWADLQLQVIEHRRGIASPIAAADALA